MNVTQWQNFLLFASTFVIVGALTPLMRKIAISKEILDRPLAAHKSHSSPVPYLGGVGIIFGVLIVTYVAIFFTSLPFNNFWLATSLIGPAFAMGLIGLWDDIKNLHPLPRFIGQTFSGIVVAVVLILTNNFGSPTGSILIDISITVVWIVGICNSINFFDNLDGGAAGTVAVAAITLTFLANSNGQALIGSLAIVVAGASLGFLIWNKSPARIYMGDAGALFLGVLIATLAIRLRPNTDTSIASFATPILLLAVPILDTTVAVVSRIFRHVSPFQGGKDHLSHRLIRAGLTKKYSAVLLWLLSALFCFLAILLTVLNSHFEIIVVVFAIILWSLLFVVFLLKADS